MRGYFSRFVPLGVCLVFASFQATLSQDKRSAEQQQKETLKQEEMSDYYRQWLAEDVFYIITDEEYDIFTKLTNDDEGDAFIEQFWFRRDPDPKTLENEFKLEHYRRLLYANEKFTAGIPGWKTDRGRIYITFGPPDRMETMPAGGSYTRLRKEGGGRTSVYPFEVWEYRRIEGVGEDIVLEFVDDRGGGLYELTYDPQRKDELLNVGFLGPTLDEIEEFERFGTRRKQYRTVRRRFAGDLPDPYRYTGGFETERDQPFSKLVLSAGLNRPPVVRFKDLEAVVTSNVFYDLIPFHVGASSVQVSDSQALALLTLDIPHRSLTFKKTAGMMTARAQVFGQISTLSRRVEMVFEEEIAREVAKERFSVFGRASSVFQKQLFLRPGLYKLNLVVKDGESGKLGTWEGRLDIPRRNSDQLALSSIILAQDIASLETGDGRFQLGRLKVVPRVSKIFRSDESLGFYFQIYHAQTDQARGKPVLSVNFAIAPEGDEPSRWRDCSDLTYFSGKHTTVARLTSLTPFKPGRYTLSVRVTDTISGQKATDSVPFSIQPGRDKGP